MKEYVITITTSNGSATFQTFAKDRKDAIDYARRTHRAKFISKEYLKVKGARLRKEEPKSWPTPKHWGEAHDPDVVKAALGEKAYEHYVEAVKLAKEIGDAPA